MSSAMVQSRNSEIASETQIPVKANKLEASNRTGSLTKMIPPKVIMRASFALPADWKYAAIMIDIPLSGQANANNLRAVCPSSMINGSFDRSPMRVAGMSRQRLKTNNP